MTTWGALGFGPQQNTPIHYLTDRNVWHHIEDNLSTRLQRGPLGPRTIRRLKLQTIVWVLAHLPLEAFAFPDLALLALLGAFGHFLYRPNSWARPYRAVPGFLLYTKQQKDNLNT